VGNVTDTYDYTAFGEALASTGTTENEFRYVGEQADANSGFYYLRKRWMDQAAGRFVSVDPFEGGIARPLSLNKYLYAEASPAWMTDPTGLFGLSEALGALTLNSILTSMARPQSRMLNYILHFRLFAPWETFGFGFGGDSRSFSTSTDPSVTSRVNSTVTIDVAGNRVLGSRGWSDPSHWGPFTRTGTPSVSVNRTGAANSRTIEVSGANPLFGDEAPPIDATLTLYWRLKDSGGACFDGVVVGDAFPNAEVFVERQGKKTSLHTFETSGDRNLGPLNYLPGKNSRSMGNFKDRCAN
jgi:RHS repeat-associated protein